MRAIVDCYPAVYATLEHDAAKDISEAKELFVKCTTFVLVSGFFKDIFGVVGKQSHVFQRDNVDIKTVNFMVSTQLKITQLKTKNKLELTQV
ncbi:hypothetical protein ACJMK2_025790 [Sinanodonta woodiana]|uniref:Uncharacterized protein n=1 Tax=Sinanodonta woodiana TaxID=1069815 RepID=A0ABD3XI37_SINWO